MLTKFMDPTDVCPITQEAIQHKVVVRGVSFEVSAIVNVLVHASGPPLHPYHRTPLTDAELKVIHRAAIETEPTILIEQGWLSRSAFLEAHGMESNSCMYPYEACVLVCVLFVIFVVLVKFL
jgi:hypothetical protein